MVVALAVAAERPLEHVLAHIDGTRLTRRARHLDDDNRLAAAFDGIDTIYRIGGDEFCIILTEPKINVESCLNSLEASCQEWKGHYVNSISVAYGFASTEEFTDFRSILKTADQRMYENKRKYYSAANAG